MTGHLDLASLKERTSFEEVLRHYGVRAVGRGRQRMALYPFHADTKPSCSIHLERKLFHCFGCSAGGSVLDFVARMENVPIHDAAARIEEICGIPGVPEFRLARAHARQDHDNQIDRPLPPLSFRLKLDPSHPYLTARGVGPELAATFGLGYCSARASMRGWICIPIHDEHGTLVAYAGRQARDEMPRGVPKYILPRGFEKRRVLFNLQRVSGAEHLVLVEGYWSVFRLHAIGQPSVALMGRVLSVEQEMLLRASAARMLTLLLDADRPGREATGELLPRLATKFFVRVAYLPDGAQPDTVPEQFLFEALSI